VLLIRELWGEFSFRKRVQGQAISAEASKSVTPWKLGLWIYNSFHRHNKECSLGDLPLGFSFMAYASLRHICNHLKSISETQIFYQWNMLNCIKF